MSYWIEYQSACFVIPPGMRGVSSPRFVLAFEGGSNNLTERTLQGRERRVREWYVGMIGTERQVLRQAVRVASDCEGSSLRLHGRQTTPEAYIRHARRLLHQPRVDVTSHITLRATVAREHPFVHRARRFGMVDQVITRFGVDQSLLEPPSGDDGSDWGAFFRAADPFIEDGTLTPNALGEVRCMPAS